MAPAWQREAGPPLVTRGRPIPGRRSGVAVGIAGRIATLQPDLVDPATAEHLTIEEEPLVEADPAATLDIELGHPGADAVWVELREQMPAAALPPGKPLGRDHARQVPGDSSGWLNRSISIDWPRNSGFLRTRRSMVAADSV